MPRAIRIVTLNPKNTDSSTLDRPPTTVNTLLRDQAQATAPWGMFLIVEIPKGKGMPRKNPRGKIKILETRILTGVGEARKRSATYGNKKSNAPPATNTPMNGQSQRRSGVISSFPDQRLPTPAESN